MTQITYPSQTNPPQCDVLLFAATRIEVDALLEQAVARKINPAEQRSDVGTFYDLGVVGTRRVVAVKTSTGGLGHKGSAANARFYVDITRASSLILVGMAFGVDRGTQEIGDVLVSAEVFPYDDRTVTRDGWWWQYDYQTRGISTYKASKALVKMVNSYLVSKRGRNRARVGCLLTGSSLVASEAYRDYLVERSSQVAENIVGGEMEAIGLLSLHSPGDCIWLVVKGISDFADGELLPASQANRRIACSNAASFVLDALAAWS